MDNTINHNNIPINYNFFNTSMHIDVVNTKFIDQLKQIINGTKNVENLSMIKIKLLFNFSKSMKIFFSTIVKIIEEFVNNLPLCLSSDFNCHIIEPKDTFYSHSFIKIINELTILFNINHSIFIQFIEQNLNEEKDFLIRQCEEYYRSIISTIDTNNTLNKSIILLNILRQSYQYLQITSGP